jgi:GNAT superfamily N-acetyltransferase
VNGSTFEIEPIRPLRWQYARFYCAQAGSRSQTKRTRQGRGLAPRGFTAQPRPDDSDTCLVLIRPARDVDVPSLVLLFAEWGHPLPQRVLEAQLAEWEDAHLADVVVAEVDHEVAGVVAVFAAPHFGRSGRFARVMGLVVGTNHQRHGVGAALMGAVEARAREWHCDQVELTSSRARESAHAFYRALGFEDQSDRQARYVRQL